MNGWIMKANKIFIFQFDNTANTDFFKMLAQDYHLLHIVKYMETLKNFMLAYFDEKQYNINIIWGMRLRTHT